MAFKLKPDQRQTSTLDRALRTRKVDLLSPLFITLGLQ
jgi:hypothetical protein